MNNNIANPEYSNNQYQLLMGLKNLPSANFIEQHPQMFSIPYVTQLNPYEQALLSYNFINQPQTPSVLPFNLQYDNYMLMSQLSYQSPNNTMVSTNLDERAPKAVNSFNFNFLDNQCLNNANKQFSTANLNTNSILNSNLNEQPQNLINQMQEKTPKTYFTLKTQTNSMKPFYKKVFRTRLLKSKLKKKENKKIYKCGHEVCGLICKTKKQIISHHGKMNQDCQKDTTHLLKAVFQTKQLMHQLILDNKLKQDKDFIRKYESIMNDVSIKEYAHLICGLTFDDIFVKEE